MDTPTLKLNPKRGFVIEKNPFLNPDLELIYHALAENDEVVIGIGSAQLSHEPGLILSAGERIELTDYVLQQQGINPARYILIPIEDSVNNAQWVGEIRMVSPRWHTVYTRNFKNASVFKAHQRAFGYDIIQVDEQKPEMDYFALIAQELKGSTLASAQIKVLFPESALTKMEEMGILSRINTIYNHARDEEARKDSIDRILFLGGMRPPTGVWAEGNGHLGALKQCLEKARQVNIVIGSAQRSDDERCPLRAGERLEIVRYALLANGVAASSFYTIPVRDIDSNATYAPRLESLVPRFTKIVSGNGLTLDLFTLYEQVTLTRTEVHGSQVPLSATYVRKTIYDQLRGKRKEQIAETIHDIERALEGALDPTLREIFGALKVYDRMHSIANRIE